MGFCLTSTGDCQGIGGARDPKLYFKNSGTQTRSGFRWNSYRATLYLNQSSVPCGINAFGWFETNSTRTVIGNMHQLFSGTGEPCYSCALTPSPVGSTVTFAPTQYFGYYYSDVSEPTQVNGVDDHGCYAYTLFTLNEPNCVGSQNNGDHDFAVFSTNPGSSHATYWIAGEDPTDCTNQDGDCNMTIVKVAPTGGSD